MVQRAFYPVFSRGLGDFILLVLDAVGAVPIEPNTTKLRMKRALRHVQAAQRNTEVYQESAVAFQNLYLVGSFQTHFQHPLGHPCSSACNWHLRYCWFGHWQSHRSETPMWGCRALDGRGRLANFGQLPQHHTKPLRIFGGKQCHKGLMITARHIMQVGIYGPAC